MSDPVNHPAHYTAGAVECIDAIEAMLGPVGFIAYCRGNAMKYQWRMGLKGAATEDARKAEWYLDRMLKALAAHLLTQDAPQPASGGAPGRRQGFKAREYHATPQAPQAPQGRAVKL
jgi:hypothetical protein